MSYSGNNILRASVAGRKQGLQKRAFGLAVASLTLCLFPLDATGQSAGITFSGNPSVTGSSCTIVVLSDGRIDASPNRRRLDSRFWGGYGAEIQVTSRQPAIANGPGFDVTFDPPVSFASAPVGTTTNIGWRVWHQGVSVSNGVNFTRSLGFRSQTLPATGISVTQVTGHLRARNNDGPYDEGFYRAIGTYRCE